MGKDKSRREWCMRELEDKMKNKMRIRKSNRVFNILLM